MNSQQKKDPFEEAIVCIYPELLRKAKRLLHRHESALDLVQDCVEKALRSRHQFQEGTHFKAWMHQILFTLFLTKCRKEKRGKVVAECLALSSESSWHPKGQEIEMKSLMPSFQKMLLELPSEQHEALCLLVFHEYTYEEASSHLGVPPGTVMSRVFRAKKMLKACIQEEHRLAA